MDIYYNKHYIRTDADSTVIKGYSDAFEQPEPGDICINEQGGRHFALFNQPNPPLQDDNGIYLYRYINGAVVLKSPAEIAAESPAPKPSQPTSDERIAAMEAAIREMAGEIYG